MECDHLLRTIGDRVRSLRKAQGMSQERLAELSGLHPVYVSNVETGRRRASLCTYQSLAESLGVSLSELVDMPGENEAWDNDLVEVFQVAKRLDGTKQKIFVQAARGVLKGLEGE